MGVALTMEDARGLMSRHFDAVFKTRTEALERLMVQRIMGVRGLRLVEDRTDPLKTVWSYEKEDTSWA